MEGIQFVRDDHLTIAEGCYLPRADLLGYIQSRLHETIFRHPELKHYIPNLLEVDLFISWDEDKFIIFISPEKRAHLPTRGMETKHLPAQREGGSDLLRKLQGFEDISDLATVQQTFSQLGFKAGFAAAGVFPAGEYTDDVDLHRKLTHLGI